MKEFIKVLLALIFWIFGIPFVVLGTTWAIIKDAFMTGVDFAELLTDWITED